MQQAERIGVAEILELNQRVRVAVLHGVDEFLDQVVVGFAALAVAQQADVERVFEQRFVVSADIDRDRQALVWVDARTGDVQRQLAHRDTHTLRAEIAQAEDAFSIRDDDDSHIGCIPIVQDLAHPPAVFDRDEQTTRSAVDMSVLHTGLADGGCVHQRHHLLEMVDQDAEKQRFIAVLQAHQEDVLLQRRALATQVVEHALDLLFQREDARREQPPEMEAVAFSFAEGGALVGQWIAQQLASLTVVRSSHVESFRKNAIDRRHVEQRASSGVNEQRSRIRKWYV